MRTASLLALLAGSLLTTAAAAQPSSFRGIGHAPGHSGAFSIVVSGDGRFVAGTALEGSARRAYRWSEQTGFEVLQPGPGWGAVEPNWGITGISADGSVIVGTAENIIGQTYTMRAFRWTSATGMVDLGALPNSPGNSRASAVSADGSIIVGQVAGHPPEHLWIAYRWTAASGMQEFLPGPRPFLAAATAISADGQTIAGTLANEAFRWSQSAGFEVIAGTEHTPAAVVAGGDVIAGIVAIQAGFRWTAAHGLQWLGGNSRGIYGASADGSLLVGYGQVISGSPYAVIWREGDGVRPLRDVLVNEYGLSLGDWQLQYAARISDDGRIIVGIGRNPQGQTEAWIARLMPNCYADCDQSGTLNIDDFICFISEYAAAHGLHGCTDPLQCYPNCDLSTTAPYLNIDDFMCFINRYALGCP
jgi:probable HAF family extracellular repeat protein